MNVRSSLSFPKGVKKSQTIANVLRDNKHVVKFIYIKKNLSPNISKYDARASKNNFESFTVKCLYQDHDIDVKSTFLI